jgi:hypothetical protein
VAQRLNRCSIHRTGRLLFQFTSGDRNARDFLGCSIDIRGNTLVVGAEHDSSFRPNSGAAYLFDLTTGERLARFLGQCENDEFGHAVAIRGQQVVIGAWASEESNVSPLIFQIPRSNR